MKRAILVAAVLALSLGAVPASADTDFYKDMVFSGTSTVNTNLWFEIRDGSGTVVVYTTDQGFIPSASTASDAVYFITSDGGGIWRQPRCATPNPTTIRLFEGDPFTVFASTDSTAWSPVTTSTAFNFGSGLSVIISSEGTYIPTLTEWGILLLTVTLGLGGLWRLRRSAIGSV